MTGTNDSEHDSRHDSGDAAQAGGVPTEVNRFAHADVVVLALATSNSRHAQGGLE